MIMTIAIEQGTTEYVEWRDTQYGLEHKALIHYTDKGRARYDNKQNANSPDR